MMGTFDDEPFDDVFIKLMFNLIFQIISSVPFNFLP